jgi:hypothetical protein
VSDEEKTREEVLAEIIEEHQAPREPRASHLKKWQWKKGQTGNPGGRPKKPDLTRLLERRLVAQDGALAKSTVAILIREALGDGKGKGPKYRFLKEILDRIEGPIVQHVRVVKEVDQHLERYLDIAERILPREQYLGLLQAWAEADADADETSLEDVESASKSTSRH